jgi:toxin ParE1/3/4
MQLSFNKWVAIEVTRIVNDYDAQSEGLGDEFLAEYNRALDRIEMHGARMAVLRDGVRAVRLKRFPYGVHYRVIGDTARVIVVKHLHRNPDYGMNRR